MKIGDRDSLTSWDLPSSLSPLRSPLFAPEPSAWQFSGANGRWAGLRVVQLGTEVGDAGGDCSQSWQAFQSVSVCQRLKFFAELVGNIPEARFQDFQSGSAQGFPLTFDSTFDPAFDSAFDSASAFDVGDVFHTSFFFKLRVVPTGSRTSGAGTRDRAGPALRHAAEPIAQRQLPTTPELTRPRCAGQARSGGRSSGIPC